MNIFTNSLLKDAKPKTPHPSSNRYNPYSAFFTYNKSSKHEPTEIRTATATKRNDSNMIKEIISKDIDSFQQLISIIKEGRAKN